MRWSFGLLLVATAAAAAPPFSGPAPQAKRKPPPEGYPAEAIDPFVEAVMADKAGNLGVALRRYQDANKISEQASTHYNIADVLRRMERWKQAIESYRRYLALAPGAPDRAEVERLIGQLETQPGTAVIDGEEPDGIVLVDGKLIGPSPVVLQLASGRHVADRITPTGYAHRTFEMRPATTEHLRMTPLRGEGGNVVLDGNLRVTGSWQDNGNEYRLPGRSALPPGRHTTFVLSRNRTCSPLVFDAPKPDELVYVFVEAAEPAQPARGGCIPIKVHQIRVRFP